MAAPFGQGSDREESFLGDPYCAGGSGRVAAYERRPWQDLWNIDLSTFSVLPSGRWIALDMAAKEAGLPLLPQVPGDLPESAPETYASGLLFTMSRRNMWRRPCSTGELEVAVTKPHPSGVWRNITQFLNRPEKRRWNHHGFDDGSGDLGEYTLGDAIGWGRIWRTWGICGLRNPSGI